MTEIWTILLVAAGAYFIYAVVLASAISRKAPALCDEYTVSLIIPARNEENDLNRCFRSIEKLNYPQDKLQVILVDHGSSDNTLKLMHEFSLNSKFRAEIAEVEFTVGKSCKSQALREGVKLADGEIFAFIDAETGFEPEWLQSMLGKIESGYDMTGGAVCIENGDGFAEMQKYDWLFLASTGAGFAGLNHPQSIFGKNMVVTRKLYEKSGGFPEEKVWTEDLELVNRCRGKGKIGFCLSEKCAVSSIAAGSWKDFFRQRIRWLRGGTNVDFPGILAMITALLMDTALVVSMFLGLRYFVVIFCLRTISDYLILRRTIKEYKLRSNKVNLPVYSLFSVAYHWIMIILTIMNKELKWR